MDVITQTNTGGAGQTRKRIRIHAENKAIILGAGLKTSSIYGFRGATIDQIAVLAGMTKSKFLCYFRRKDDIYLAALGRKLKLSRNNPAASHLFAMEIIQFAPALGEVLKGRLKWVVDANVSGICRRIGEGRLAPFNPHHFIFPIWATVKQHESAPGLRVWPNAATVLP